VSCILVRFGKPFFPTYQILRLHIPEDSNLHSHGHVSPRYHFCLQLVEILLALKEMLAVPCRISLSTISNRNNRKSFVCLLEYEGFESLFFYSTRVVTSCEHRNSRRRLLLSPPNLYLLQWIIRDDNIFTDRKPKRNFNVQTQYKTKIPHQKISPLY